MQLSLGVLLVPRAMCMDFALMIQVSGLYPGRASMSPVSLGFFLATTCQQLLENTDELLLCCVGWTFSSPYCLILSRFRHPHLTHVLPCHFRSRSLGAPGWTGLLQERKAQLELLRS